MGNSSDIAQSDLTELLTILGMGDHARPQSPHEVFQEALGVLRKRLGKPAPDGTRTGDEGTEENWRADPSADERWCAGVDYAQEQLCHVLGVDPSDVNWDAATETLDGDMQAVICTILAAWGGDDWQALAARPEAPSDAGWSQAARDVLAERRRQVAAEGYSFEHDDNHARGELAAAAACYALPLAVYTGCLAPFPPRGTLGLKLANHVWPWAPGSFRRKSRREDLIRAAALLIAEVERLDRLEVRGK